MAPTKTSKTTTTETEIDESTLSRQAHHSTYAEAEVPETNPPGGRVVEQTRGEPQEGPVTAFGS